MENNNELKSRVMKKIFIDYYIHKTWSNLGYFLPAFCFIVLATLVSMADIWINISHTQISSLYPFIKAALRDTEIAVQIAFSSLVLSLLIPLYRKLSKKSLTWFAHRSAPSAIKY